MPGARSLSLAVGATIALLGAFLILFRLDHRLLWIDEAETALLGRSILVHGLPIAVDGNSVISQEVGREYGPNRVWRWTPWVEKYLAAGSFALLGESTFSARLPFALLGVLSVVSVAPLAVLLFRDRWIGVLAMAFLALSVPFLLHVRQCRYYSPAIFASIWALYFFVAMARGRRWSVVGFTGAMTLLFHSNNLNAGATGVALLACAAVVGFDRAALKRAVIAAILIVLINAPWAWAFAQGKTDPRLYSYTENLRFHLELINLYTLPIAAVLAFLCIAGLGRKRYAIVEDDDRRSVLLLILFPVVYVVAISAAPWSFFRYTVGLLPVAAVLMAFMSRRLLAWNRVVGAAFTVSLLLTGLWSQVLAAPLTFTKYNILLEGRSSPTFDLFFPLGNYLGELSRPYAGPMERLVDYLRENAKPGERVFISYGDLILMFYTKLEVRGGQSGQSLADWHDPEWIVVRSFFRFGDRPDLRADADRVIAWLHGDLSEDDYEEVATLGTDVPWDDIQEPQLHWYRVPEGGSPMHVYRHKGH